MRIFSLVTSASALALLAACSSSSSGGANDVSNLSPTWSNVYSAVLAKRCLPCHATATGVSQGQLDLSAKDKAYTNLVSVDAAGTACTGKGKRVVPGQASSSLLYTKTSSSPPCGLQMPFQISALSSSQRNLIKDWINGGAMNN